MASSRCSAPVAHRTPEPTHLANTHTDTLANTRTCAPPAGAAPALAAPPAPADTAQLNPRTSLIHTRTPLLTHAPVLLGQVRRQHLQHPRLPQHRQQRLGAQHLRQGGAGSHSQPPAALEATGQTHVTMITIVNNCPLATAMTQRARGPQPAAGRPARRGWRGGLHYNCRTTDSLRSYSLQTTSSYCHRAHPEGEATP